MHETEIAVKGIAAILWTNKIAITVIVVAMLAFILAIPPVGVVIAFVIAAVVVLISLKERSLAGIGFESPESWPQVILISLALGIIIELSFQVFFNPLIERFTGKPLDVSALDAMRGNLGAFLAMLAVGWVVGGFIEEITFRGFLITRIKALLGDSSLVLLLALVVTSGAFGLSHSYQGTSGMLSTGIIAFIFGLIFIKAGYNLWIVILTNGFVNTVGMTLIYLNYDKYLRGLLKIAPGT